MWKEFKEFAFQGNVLDLAIAVVIGAAFNDIVTSLVENMIMPLVGVLMQGINFEGLMWQVGDAEVTYGVFIQSVINFFIITAAIFLFIKIVIRKKKEEEPEAEPEVSAEQQLLTEIRDLLKEQAR